VNCRQDLSCSCVGCVDPWASLEDIPSIRGVQGPKEPFPLFGADGGGYADAAQWVGGDPIGVNEPAVLEMLAALGVQGRLVGMRGAERDAMPGSGESTTFDPDPDPNLPNVVWTPNVDIPVPTISTEPTGLGDVDIYVSLGRAGSCDRDHPAGCSLYRIHVHQANLTAHAASVLGPTAAITVTKVVSSTTVAGTSDGTSVDVGAVQPAVSPSGRYLAYTLASDDHKTLIMVRDLTTGSTLEVDRGGGPWGCKPQFPAWFGDGILLYSKATEDTCHGEDTSSQDQSVYLAIVGDDFGQPALLAGPTGWLGPDGLWTKRDSPVGPVETNFGDADVRQPWDVSLADLTQPIVATHGQRTGSGEQPSVRLHPLVPTGRRVETQEFSLGRTSVFGDPRDIQSPQHPAWSPDGDELVTHVHQAPEGDGRGVEADVYQMRNVYAFADDGGWGRGTGTAAPAFPHQLPDWFESTGLFDAACRQYSHKQQQFCGTPEWIVTGVFCKDKDDGAGEGILTSRTYLVNRTTGDYWDLTATIAAAFGTSERSSYTSTCWRDRT